MFLRPKPHSLFLFIPSVSRVSSGDVFYNPLPAGVDDWSLSLFLFLPLKMSGMAGTKRYMAPEACSGLAYNEKVDVYSFSIVLWQICTLLKPFAGMSEAEHLQHVVVGGLRPPLDHRWPPGLSAVLQCGWHPNPNYRPSMVDIRQMLRDVFVAGGGQASW